MSTETTVDRRVRKTRKQLKDCLIALLKEKKVQDITVRELTEMADLNRGTFYLHYKDVFDLLDQTEGELLSTFNQLVSKERIEDLKDRLIGIFTDVYTLVQQNADFVTILIGEHGDMNFVNRLKGLVRETCLQDWMGMFPTSGNPEVFEAYLSFVVAGCMGLVQHWLKSGMKESPAQLASLTEQIITQGIRVLVSAPGSVPGFDHKTNS